MAQSERLPKTMRSYLRMPFCQPGMRIGLFGGSFNPPHAGHVHVSEQALRRLELDQIWWLVTPGNPLKDHSELAPMKDRIKACEAITSNPAIRITGCEAAMKTNYTADTLAHILRRNRDVNFVWVMGADNLGQFHRWERWREIADMLPMAIVDRPGSTLALHSAQAAQALAQYRLDELDAPVLAGRQTPAWVFLHGPRNALSSTKLRAMGSQFR